MMRRRVLLAGAAGIATSAAAGFRYLRPEPQQPIVPGAPAGDERVEPRRSVARGRTVDFYTAVPAGHGDGRGLPVCLVLHGASKTAADFPALNLGGFLTAAVRRGAPPFVLAGATGDRLSWRPSGADDPQRMVHEEIPGWCAARGFDTSRLAAWGWSMGGYGSLLLAATFPGFVGAVAAFAPAVSRDVPDVTDCARSPSGCGAASRTGTTTTCASWPHRSGRWPAATRTGGTTSDTGRGASRRRSASSPASSGSTALPKSSG
jgi:hypothetical protein